MNFNVGPSSARIFRINLNDRTVQGEGHRFALDLDADGRRIVVFVMNRESGLLFKVRRRRFANRTHPFAEAFARQIDELPAGAVNRIDDAQADLIFWIA